MSAFMWLVIGLVVGGILGLIFKATNNNKD